MLKACEICGSEAIHFIHVESLNIFPAGNFWFCRYEHLGLWAARIIAERTRPIREETMKDEKAMAAAAALTTTLAPLPVSYGTPASLDHLRDLEHGWDGDDAPAPTEEAIAAGEAILNSQPKAVPTLDGGVQLDWPNGFELVITSLGTQELE